MTVLVGVAGSSGSGKTTASKFIAEKYGGRCVVISSDNYYRGKSKMPATATSFDHPDSIDFPRLVADLKKLKAGQDIDMPEYDFSVSEQKDTTIKVKPSDIVVVEGILIFYYPELLELFDIKVFVDTDIEICKERRIDRDMKGRGRERAAIIQQWDQQVLPAYQQFVEPTKYCANVIVNNNEETVHLQSQIKKILPIINSLHKLANSIISVVSNIGFYARNKHHDSTVSRHQLTF